MSSIDQPGKGKFEMRPANDDDREKQLGAEVPPEQQQQDSPARQMLAALGANSVHRGKKAEAQRGRTIDNPLHNEDSENMPTGKPPLQQE